MDRHRRVAPDTLLPHPTEPPFSCFDWAEVNLAPTESIRRCFSLARSLGMQALVAEDITADGLVLEENQELQSAISDYTMPALKRLSFWKKNITCSAMLADMDADSLCGYAILKHDRAPSRQRDHWHVFEAVFRKYPHEHNCVPQQKHYLVRVGSKEFSIPGVLYAQQNGLNKVCAHVALRTLLARLLPAGDVSYAAMNRLAAKTATVSFDPANGLGVVHIRAIIEHYKLGFRDIDYVTEEKRNKRIRHTHPFESRKIAAPCKGLACILTVFALDGPEFAGVGLGNQVDAFICGGQFEFVADSAGHVAVEPDMAQLGGVFGIELEKGPDQFLEQIAFLLFGQGRKVLSEVVPAATPPHRISQAG